MILPSSTIQDKQSIGPSSSMAPTHLRGGRGAVGDCPSSQSPSGCSMVSTPHAYETMGKILDFSEHSWLVVTGTC